MLRVISAGAGSLVPLQVTFAPWRRGCGSSGVGARGVAGDHLGIGPDAGHSGAEGGNGEVQVCRGAPAVALFGVENVVGDRLAAAGAQLARAVAGDPRRGVRPEKSCDVLRITGN